MSAPVKKCEVCDDTGSKSRDMGGDMDCTACEAALERANLDGMIERQRFPELREMVWSAYQLGKAAASVLPDCSECEGRGFTYSGEGTPGNGFDVAPEPPEQECCQSCGGNGKDAAAAPVVPVAAQPVVPEGFQLVPTEINAVLAMGWAYLDAARENDPGQHYSFNHAGWRALLEKAKEYQPAAAPSLEAQPAVEVALADAMKAGYEGGTLVTDPTNLGATINLHYESSAEAENAFKSIVVAIDHAIAMAQGEKA